MAVTVSGKPREFSRDELKRFGITRVGDLTGLDTIGIPVWFACRPGSRSLSVSHGKGIDTAQARISAIMELIEGAVAERPRDLVAEYGSYDEMRARGLKVVPLEAMARCHFSAFDPFRARAWVRGWSCSNGEDVFAPFELIGLDMRADFPWDSGAFTVSSEGLAAGTTHAFASLRAVLELVEHDATTPLEMLGLSSGAARPIVIRPGSHAGLDSAIAMVRAVDVEPRFFLLSGKVQMPVVAAVIDWVVQASHGPTKLCCAGYACRFSAADAALAALLESVQSRATEIAGAREDLESDRFDLGDVARWNGAARNAELEDIASEYPVPVALDDEARLELLVSRVMASGASDVFLFALTGGQDAIHVVRALAADLQSSADRPGFLSARGISALLAGARL